MYPQGMRNGETGAATLHIGEVAKRTGLSVDTIRCYEKQGLVGKLSRSEGGFRLYLSTDVEGSG